MSSAGDQRCGGAGVRAQFGKFPHQGGQASDVRVALRHACRSTNSLAARNSFSSGGRTRGALTCAVVRPATAAVVALVAVPVEGAGRGQSGLSGGGAGADRAAAGHRFSGGRPPLCPQAGCALDSFAKRSGRICAAFRRKLVNRDDTLTN